MNETNTVDPRAIDPRLELPFDQYQRYQVTKELFEGFKVPPGSLVLEVGGGPGPLEAFLPEYELMVSDISGAHLGRFLLADGAALPFADETFAAVVTLDTLEHVPARFRTEFLAELLRVSSDLVMLSAPFASPELELAEEALNEFIRARFQGDFPTLDEHAQNGLPELGPTTDALGAAGLLGGHAAERLPPAVAHGHARAPRAARDRPAPPGQAPRVLQRRRVAPRLPGAVVPARDRLRAPPAAGRGPRGR